MSLINRLFVLNVAMIAMAASAVAGNTKPGPMPTTPGKPISWEEMKERCADRKQFDDQLAPENVTIQCTDTRLVWDAGAPGEIPLPGKRTVTSAVFASKFFVDAEQVELPTVAKSGSCLRFVEMEEEISVDVPVSCDQIVGMKGDLSDFCAAQLDTTKGSSPGKVEREPTGRVVDSCHGHGKPGKDGKK